MPPNISAPRSTPVFSSAGLAARPAANECLVFDDLSGCPLRTDVRSMRWPAGRGCRRLRSHPPPDGGRFSLAVGRQARLRRRLRASPGRLDVAERTRRGGRPRTASRVSPAQKLSRCPRETGKPRAAECSCRSGASAKRPRSLAEACTEDMALSPAVRATGSIGGPAPSIATSRGFRSSASGRTRSANGRCMVSGFYKSWRFVAVGPVENRPVLCDDTCYFLPCRSAAEARRRAGHLNSERGREFFSAFVFNQSKRPLTAEILSLLDLEALAAELEMGRGSISAGPAR